MIRRVGPAGSITTVAGTGNDGADGDASLTSPRFARSTGCGKTDVKRAYRLVCSHVVVLRERMAAGTCFPSASEFARDNEWR
jgi:hypothetical protein